MITVDGEASTWTEASVGGLLLARHAPPEWAFVSGLRSHVGYSTPGRESYLDAFAMRCWPGKGLTRIAYEIKVSRSDWLRELKDPTKRAQGMKLAHEFWFVAPTGVIRADETPEGCGWMEVGGGGLRTRKAAPYREVEAMPEAFLASLLRTLAGTPRDAVFKAPMFKLAGKELSLDDLLAAQADVVEQAVRSRVEAALREALAATPEFALARAVAKAMDWPTWRYTRMPDPEKFEQWLLAYQIAGGAVSAREEVDRAVGRLEEAARDLRRISASLS